MLSGLVLVFVAAFFQGTFVLPMTLARKWRWEQTWITFSILGMLVFNWALAFLTIPGLAVAFSSVALGEIAVLLLFGAGWGAGAVLFGLSMDRLGMSLGYPIIMGLIACLGALIPMAVFFPHTLLAEKGLMLLAGTGLAVLGITLCSIGGARRQPDSAGAPRQKHAAALAMAVLAGVLSCFPNVGMAFGGPLIAAAAAAGAPESAAANAVWMLLFTAGGAVNCAYCVWLMVVRKSGAGYFGPETRRNLGLAALMAALWIGSFYLYGAGSRRLGEWGVVAGWPVFISLSIAAGVFWGLWRGEWDGAPAAAIKPRNSGLAVLFVAVLVISLSNLL